MPSEANFTICDECTKKLLSKSPMIKGLIFYINEKHTEERAAQYLKQVHTSKPIFLEKKINIAFSIVVNYSTPC